MNCVGSVYKTLPMIKKDYVSLCIVFIEQIYDGMENVYSPESFYLKILTFVVGLNGK